MLYRTFKFHTRHYYILLLRSLFLTYKYCIFIHDFVNSFNNFKIACLNLDLNIFRLNSSLISGIFSNLNFFNYMKSKYILLYSNNDNFFKILDYIKVNSYIKIFAISFKNHFIDLKWFLKINSENQMLVFSVNLFIFLFFFKILYLIIFYLFRSLFYFFFLNYDC